MELVVTPDTRIKLLPQLFEQKFLLNLTPEDKVPLNQFAFNPKTHSWDCVNDPSISITEDELLELGNQKLIIIDAK